MLLPDQRPFSLRALRLPISRRRAGCPCTAAGNKDPRPGIIFLRQFAREKHIPLADAARRWEGLEELGIPYETLMANGINHPDARGYEYFVEELMGFFPQKQPGQD
jgi:hypothetical protein